MQFSPPPPIGASTSYVSYVDGRHMLFRNRPEDGGSFVAG
jgi:hypothetical protein